MTASHSLRQIRSVLHSAKKAIVSDGWEWYPYQSFMNAILIDRLLADARVPLEELLANGPVLDIGCADGDMSFYLESLGARELDAVDFAPTNFNAMRGIRALKQHLGSSIAIHELDLDGRFELPRERYGVCLALGLLYHLKNPYYFLEELSKRVDYCFVSTRVARRLPGLTEPVDRVPAAYLLESDELNNDQTNFWIFTDAGLRRLLRRTGWEILSYQHNVAIPDSDPVDSHRDQRAFCFLRNRGVKPWRGAMLRQGWYALERGRFRWTERRFTIDVPSGGNLNMQIYIPERLLKDRGEVTLDAAVEGVHYPRSSFREPGFHEYQLCIHGGGEVRFETAPGVLADRDDARDRGLVVASLEVK